MYSVQQFNLVSAYGAFFQGWAWDHYATLTFGRKLSPANCIRHWNEFINSLGRTTRGRVGWVRADEQRWSGWGTPEIPFHYHALLKHKNVPTPQVVASLWKAEAGDALVEDYRSGGGGGGGAGPYIAKMFPYADTGYDVGGLEHFPRLGEGPIRGSAK